MRAGRGDSLWGDQAEDLRAEGGRKPDVGGVACARRRWLFCAAVVFGNATVVAPLAAVVIAIHVGHRRNAHAPTAAKAGPLPR